MHSEYECDCDYTVCKIHYVNLNLFDKRQRKVHKTQCSNIKATLTAWTSRKDKPPVTDAKGIISNKKIKILTL